MKQLPEVKGEGRPLILKAEFFSLCNVPGIHLYQNTCWKDQFWCWVYLKG